MNILIPYRWLLEHLETKASPEKLEEYLSLCGPSVERIETSEGEPVLDIEITTNRVDSMSIRGIAREAVAILPEFKIAAKMKPVELAEIRGKERLKVKIKNDPKLCKRIIAVKLTDLKIGPSPKWLQKRLIQVGQRPLNNLIDVTNYVMWEIGHPVHVFDYDRLGGKIVVREARKGEKLVTLDGKGYVLNGGEVVFDDGTGKITDLPGIMGTANTVVSEKTKNILVWIESIDAVKIRQASMGLAIRTQAAILNEKRVDPELAMEAMRRGIAIYEQIGAGRVASELTDIYPRRQEIVTTELKQQLVDTYLGVEVSRKRVVRILEALGIKVRTKGTSYQLTPPSWRAEDLCTPVDYVEEIARIYGYHNLFGEVMAGKIPDNPQGDYFELEGKIKWVLADWGLQEVYTYSMVSEELAKMSGFGLGEHLEIKNPLSEDWGYLRRSLIPSHLKVLKENKAEDELEIFELANVYIPKKGQLPEEELHLLITSDKGYKRVKGLLEGLFTRWYLGKPRVVETKRGTEGFAGGESGVVMAGESNEALGMIGKVKVGQGVYGCLLKIKPLLTVVKTHPRFRKLFDYPPIIQDLTFELPEKTYVGQMIEEIEEQVEMVAKVKLVDSFKNARTLRVWFQDRRKNLTDEEVRPVREKIIEMVGKKFGGKLKE
jgi:phenylalanyl-tRNA synthetase beta chain